MPQTPAPTSPNGWRTLYRRTWRVFALFLGVTLVFRLPSFEYSVLDWDESLYFLMARDLLDGHPLYTTVWDLKPPGIYLVFALGQVVFGDTVLSIRLLASLAVALTSTLLFRFGREVLGSPEIGLVAGLLYSAFSLNSGGIASNTELFFAPFVVLAFLWLFTRVGFPDRLDWEDRTGFVIVGLVFGIALQFKYVAVFDLGAVLVLLAIAGFRGGHDRAAARVLKAGATMLAAALSPFVAVGAYFWLTGSLAGYYETNFAAHFVYGPQTPFSLSTFATAFGSQIRDNFFLWLCLILAPLIVLGGRHRLPSARWEALVLGLWVLFALGGASFTKRFYDHYFLQALPPLTLIAAAVVIRGASSARLFSRRLPRILFLATMAAIIASPYLNKFFVGSYASPLPIGAIPGLAPANRTDIPSRIGTYIGERIAPGSYIFIPNYEPIIYHLAGARLPTRYFFPSILIQERNAIVVGIDQLQVLDQVMAKRPLFVVVSDREMSRSFDERLAEHLVRDYTLDSNIGGVDIYKLK